MKSLFLDTMNYLHYAPIDRIDFCSEIAASEVLIVVPRVILSELSKHKDQNPSQKIRERARSALKLIEAVVENEGKLSSNVTLKFHNSTPSPAEHGLDPSNNDDVFIAAAIEFCRSNPNGDILVVTNDTGARLMCRHLGLATFVLSDKYLLPKEQDSSEQEIRRLRDELTKLKSARPQLSLGFCDSQTNRLKFTLCDPGKLNPVKLEKRIAKLRAQFPSLPIELEPKSPIEKSLMIDANRVSQLLNPTFISEADYDGYNSKRLAYFEQMEVFYRDQIDHGMFSARTFGFSLELSNDGTSPATDIDVRIHFPNGFAMYNEDSLPVGPVEPKPPEPPKSSLARSMENLSRLGNVRMVPNFRSPNLPTTDELKKTNSYEFTDRFSRIKHGTSEVLRELFITFDTFSDVKSFNADYKLIVGNLPDAIEGTLHFISES